MISPRTRPKAGSAATSVRGFTAGLIAPRRSPPSSAAGPIGSIACSSPTRQARSRPAFVPARGACARLTKSGGQQTRRGASERSLDFASFNPGFLLVHRIGDAISSARHHELSQSFVRPPREPSNRTGRQSSARDLVPNNPSDAFDNLRSRNSHRFPQCSITMRRERRPTKSSLGHISAKQAVATCPSVGEGRLRSFCQ